MFPRNYPSGTIKIEEIKEGCELLLVLTSLCPVGLETELFLFDTINAGTKHDITKFRYCLYCGIILTIFRGEIYIFQNLMFIIFI